MGGDGSGRKPDPIKSLIAFNIPAAPAGQIILPNLSGVQNAALKTSAPLSAGGGHIIQEEGSDLTARSYLNFSGAAVTAYDDGTATVVSIDAAGAESDPVFLSLSGAFLTSYTETDPQFLALSGAFLTSYTETDPVFLSLSGAFLTSTHSSDNTDPHGANLIQTGITSSGTISGAKMLVTADHTASGAAQLVGIITHTSATPPTASNYPQGTLYIQYTA